ncbi:alkaline phosphatase family protein [Alkalibacillus haloalkaliphilus]|uniref:alkaline phosphatase family protein n=1 Tax=Alkalibacillus haloalkaliphilus TaxID=94136 RepID=UPI0029363B99|nr:alkaline phosphatase family protein [Alkalibacillus haloalkaliphilus]MDV2582946.1 alkaline phosphatase family protein [Alkalibacillus haloalkaliphilus]
MNRPFIFLLIVLFSLTISSCQSDTAENEEYQEQVDSSFSDKKVVMVMIDSIMDHTLNHVIEEGDAPALQFLKENGQYYPDLIAPVPSMSVTIESTILTGEMPDQHHVPGLAWYDAEADRIVNYGTTWQFWLKNDFTASTYDVLYRLNNEHLNKDVTTIFEDLDEEGLTSASINLVVYRGNHSHQLKVPLFLDEVTDLPETVETKGPNVLALGRVTKPEIIEDDDNLSDSLIKRIGFQDEYSMEVAQQLIEQDDQPDFTFIFFPENDRETHKEGPSYTGGVVDADQYLQDILNSYDSWEQAIEENIFIVFGDHGQDQMLEKEEDIAIDLENLYAEYSLSKLGEPVSQGEVAFGINQRSAYVYDVQNAGLLPELAEHSLQDSRIDFAAWQEGDEVHVISPDIEGSLQFNVKGEWVDRYDQSWSIEGNEQILDLYMSGNEVVYSDYPDVLNHLITALNSHDTPKIMLAAKPGHSFRAEGITIHEAGGEHGGLHKHDILASMIVTGTNQTPEYLRMVDFKEYILSLLTDNSEPINDETSLNE